MHISIPWGRTHLTAELPDHRIRGVLKSRLEGYVPPMGQRELVEAALASPIGSQRLEVLASGKKNIVLIASDHTRPVPSKVLVPPMLEAIRRGNPEAEITILIATGCHRGTTKDELIEKFGPEIVAKERIVIHDCEESENMVTLGTLPSGGTIRINRLAAEADLLISEGFIEPHFFAGFSGGRKSVLPGIVARETVHWNHNAEFIADPHSRTGILENNPIHRDMIFAARAAKLAFICNVVINAKHEVVGAFAGDCEQAQLAGARFLKDLCACSRVEADIVITSNNGYPLDQNIYQSVKGLTAAEASAKEGAVLIMCADLADGTGGEGFYQSLKNCETPAAHFAQCAATPQNETIPDQWESQILARILMKHRVIFVSRPEMEATLREMKLDYAPDLATALAMAKAHKGENAKVTLIPNGISVMVKK